LSQNIQELLSLEPAEMLTFDETPTMEQLREKKQLYFDDVNVGDQLPRYVRKRSVVEFQRWSITMENTHRLHFDITHTANHDKLPGLLFHGTWRLSIVTSWLKNWCIPDGWVWKAAFQVRAMVVAGETTALWGEVTDTQHLDDYGLVDIRFGIVNEDGVEGCPGTAVVALPFRGGQPVPYPFVPPAR
jgi:acyl dehydratase